jgi:Zn-finger nucleic acid-binding protein
VWLDRGELDKNIERASMGASSWNRDTEERFSRHDRDDDERYTRTRRRKSFLEELFDFD